MPSLDLAQLGAQRPPTKKSLFAAPASNEDQPRKLSSIEITINDTAAPSHLPLTSGGYCDDPLSSQRQLIEELTQPYEQETAREQRHTAWQDLYQLSSSQQQLEPKRYSLPIIQPSQLSEYSRACGNGNDDENYNDNESFELNEIPEEELE